MRKNVSDLNGGITFVCKRHLFYSYVIMSTAFLAKSAKKKLKISGFFFYLSIFLKHKTGNGQPVIRKYEEILKSYYLTF